VLILCLRILLVFVQIKRQLKEGGLGRRGNAAGARGEYRADQLTALSAEERREAKRNGLATSDDEVSGDEKEEDNDDDEMDQAIKQRHLGAEAMPVYSDSETDDDEDDSGPANAGKVARSVKRVMSQLFESHEG